MTFTADYFKKWTKYVLCALNDSKLRKLELINSTLLSHNSLYFDLRGSAEITADDLHFLIRFKCHFEVGLLLSSCLCVYEIQFTHSKTGVAILIELAT